MIAVSQVYLILQINSLKTKVQQTENGIAYARDYLERNIDEIYSTLSPRFEGESGYSGQEPYNYRMKGNISMGSSVINGDNSFKDIKYMVTLDDKIIKTYQADLVGSGNIEINENYKMETGQELIGKVIATDRLNFTHEYLIMHYVGGEGEQREHYYENEKIIAPDGTPIYNGDESALY